MQSSRTLSLRKVVRDDVGVVWEWYKDHVRLNFPKQEPKEGFMYNDLFLAEGEKRIAMNNGVPVGFLWVSWDYNIFEGKVEGMVRFLHVDKKARKGGVGRYLMEQAEIILKEKEAEYITLGTSFQNKAARSFYNKIGYRPTRALYRKEIK